jgi:hypothetical protein
MRNPIKRKVKMKTKNRILENEKPIIAFPLVK